jgi:hypothetical protein
MAGILKVDQVQSDSNLSFQVAGANVAYMNSTGLQMTGGQIIAGSNTLITSSGLIYANAGIQFPGTQVASGNANTLDDYEEGTFTPTVIGVGGTGGGAITGSTVAGYYTKFGNVVHVAYAINNSTVPTYTGIFGLSVPFSAGGADAEWRSGDVYYYTNGVWSTGATFVGMSASIFSGQNYITFSVHQTNSDRQTQQGTTTTSKPAAGSTSMYLRFNIVYMTG